MVFFKYSWLDECCFLIILIIPPACSHVTGTKGWWVVYDEQVKMISGQGLAGANPLPQPRLPGGALSPTLSCKFVKGWGSKLINKVHGSGVLALM
jgi:hypothetical protein